MNFLAIRTKARLFKLRNALQVVLAIVLGALAGLSGQGAARQGAHEEPCVALAREAVAGLLRTEGLEPERWRLELLGEPVELPPRREPEGQSRSDAPTSGVEGVVTDSLGAALPGVTVELVSSNAPSPATVLSDAAGRFRFEEIGPGEATLRFHLTGYKQHLYTVRLEVGEVRQVRPRLEAGSSSEEIMLAESDLRAPLPSTIVPLGVTILDEGFRPFLAYCIEDRVVPVQLQPDGGNGRPPFPREEFERASEALQDFYRHLLDLELGSGRMGTYVASDMLRLSKSVFRDDPSSPSDEELRDWISVWLVNSALEAWSRVEGLPAARRSEPHGADFDTRRRLDEERLTRLEGELRRVGAATPQRLEAVTPYLRRLLGEGLMLKLKFEPGGELDGVVPTGVVYKTVLPPLHLFFAWREERLRLVLMMVD